MSIQPFPYKPLAHQQALLNNLIGGFAGQLQSQINGQPCAISLAPVMATRQFDFEFQVTVDGLPVRIQTTRDLFAGMTIGGSSLPDLLEQLPDDLRLGCASLAIERLLGDLRALVQKDMRLSRVSRSDHIPEGTPCLGITFQSQTAAASGLLVVNDQIHNMISNALDTAQATSGQPRAADHLAMPLAVEVGHTILSDTRLRQLASGDIVLLDRSWLSLNKQANSKHVFLRMSESSGFLAEISGSQVTLKQRVENGMSDEFDDFDDLDDDLDLGDDFDDDDDLGFTDAPAAQAAPEEMAPPVQAAPQQATPQASTQHVNHQDVQGLPVKLVFDIGNHELTVGEMGRLGPGYTFELNRNIASPVTMKANGKAFAECELVNINNQIGARITKLL